MTDLFKTVKMSNEWRGSILILNLESKVMSKHAGTLWESNYSIYTMKLWERVIKSRIRQVSTIRENPFGFMPGRSTTEAINARG